MPVIKCPNGKYKIGENGACVYENEEVAMNAYKGYLSKEHSFQGVPMQITLAENTPIEEIPEKVQLLRTCTFYHKQYGKVEITRQMFSEMIKNFEKKIRGIDVMIDYAHDSDREAAGWIKNLEVIENLELSEAELWANVEWTPKGRKTLSDKEFAYLSADFDPNYIDNENPSMKHGCVLLGAGLTNRPVVKKMKPAIQLSEFSTNEKEIYKMDDQQKAEGEAVKKQLSDAQAKLAEVDNLMKSLGVSSIEELMSLIQGMKKDNVELAEQKEKTEKENKLNVLLSEGKISQAQKEIALTLKKEEFGGFVKLAESNGQVVKTTEVGHDNTPKGDESEDVEEKIFELADKKAKAEKIDFADAVSIVLSENKELAKKYYSSKDEE